MLIWNLTPLLIQYNHKTSHSQKFRSSKSQIFIASYLILSFKERIVSANPCYIYRLILQSFLFWSYMRIFSVVIYISLSSLFENSANKIIVEIRKETGRQQGLWEKRGRKRVAKREQNHPKTCDRSHTNRHIRLSMSKRLSSLFSLLFSSHLLLLGCFSFLSLPWPPVRLRRYCWTLNRISSFLFTLGLYWV